MKHDEVFFLDQAIRAVKIRMALDSAGPVKPNEPVVHAHFCKHCDTTWSCVCHDSQPYELKRHGCPEQREYAKKMAIMLSMADRDSRVKQPERKPLSKQDFATLLDMLSKRD